MSEVPPSTLAIFRAWPTVRINARESDRVRELITGMEMVEQADGLSSLELRLSNVASDPEGGADFAFEDEAALKLGDSILVYAGEESAPREIFNGIITGLEADFPSNAPPELVVLAEDRLQTARLKRRTKVHENLTLSRIAGDIASNLGLTPRITGFSEDLGVQVQFNESDLAFLRRLLVRYDGDVQVVGTELHVSPRNEVQRGTLTLELNSQLRRATLLADLAHQATEVTLTGWDAKRGRRVTGRSNRAAQGPGQGRSGANLLRQALGERSHHLGHLMVNTEKEANAVAEAALAERQRRFVCVQGSAEGNPRLRVGTHITLTGLGRRFSNTYYVVRCCHRFDLSEGYLTDFTAECAFLGQP